VNALSGYRVNQDLYNSGQTRPSHEDSLQMGPGNASTPAGPAAFLDLTVDHVAGLPLDLEERSHFETILAQTPQFGSVLFRLSRFFRYVNERHVLVRQGANLIEERIVLLGIRLC